MIMIWEMSPTSLPFLQLTGAVRCVVSLDYSSLLLVYVRDILNIKLDVSRFAFRSLSPGSSLPPHKSRVESEGNNNFKEDIKFKSSSNFTVQHTRYHWAYYNLASTTLYLFKYHIYDDWLAIYIAGWSSPPASSSTIPFNTWGLRFPHTYTPFSRPLSGQYCPLYILLFADYYDSLFKHTAMMTEEGWMTIVGLGEPFLMD